MITAKRCLTAICISMILLTGVTGCIKTTKSSQQTQESIDNESDSNITQENTDNETSGSTTQEKVVSISREDIEFLSGKVQSVETDGMTIAQTSIMGQGEDAGMVTIVDEKDAKKISVKFTADTKVEHWTITGGGADIDMKDAALSDLTAGMGVEMQGYYEGESFTALRILIEEYV